MQRRALILAILLALALAGSAHAATITFDADPAPVAGARITDQYAGRFGVVFSSRCGAVYFGVRDFAFSPRGVATLVENADCPEGAGLDLARRPREGVSLRARQQFNRIGRATAAQQNNIILTARALDSAGKEVAAARTVVVGPADWLTVALASPVPGRSIATVQLSWQAPCCDLLLFDNLALAPDTALGATPGAESGPAASFAFTADEPGARFECRLDAGPWTACGGGASQSYAGLADGRHAFAVRAVDALGAVDPHPATHSWTVVTPPTPTPTPQPDPCVGPTGPGQPDADRDAISDRCDASNGALRPVPLRTTAVRVLTGRVYIRYPLGARPLGRVAQVAPGAPLGFEPLVGAATIPLGSTVDMSSGRLAVVSAADASGRRQQRAEFSQGVAQIRQVRARRAQRRARELTTQLRLGGASLASACPTPRPGRRSSPRVVRRLWGDGTGRFQTVGHGSVTSVRGTVWLTEDRCDGTLTRVTRGSVTVRDLTRRGRTVTVRAGHRYLTRAPSLRKGRRRPVAAPASRGEVR